jgi:hypothetical protein
MGVFDIVDKFVDGVSDVAEKVKQTAEWVKEIAQTLGLPKLGDIAKTVGEHAGKLVVAPTFVLQEGQKHIEKMLKSCGEGEPVHAMEFFDSGQAFEAAQKPLSGAYPSDQWSGGTAPEAYAKKVREQENRVVALADLDKQLHTLIDREAVLLPPMRNLLRIRHNDLADFGNFTQYMGKIGRYGKGAQYALETAMVASTLAEVIPKYESMQDEADAIARSVAEVGDEYKKIADGVTISDSANDYDPRMPR